jgi:hypothetical protein
VVARGSLVAIFLGSLLGVALVVGSYSVPVQGPARVNLDGVALTVTYLNRSSSLFGPVEQNGCNETLPTTSGWPTFGPRCPAQLVVGTTYDLQFFVTGNPGSSPGLWVNMTVAAPFDFQLYPAPTDNPTWLSNGSGLYEATQTQLYQMGQWSGWALVFTFPAALGPVGPNAGGLWLRASLTVQPTNQTFES